MGESSKWYKDAKPFLNTPAVIFQLFIGLDKKGKELDDLPWHLVRAFSSNRDVGKVYKEYLSLSLEEALDTDIQLYGYTSPSIKDPTYEERHPGKATLEAFALANNDWFKSWQHLPVKKRGDDYDGLKKAFGQKILEKILDIYPHLKDHVDCLVYGTSAAANFYLNRNAGGGAKLENTRARMCLEASAKMRADSGIPGLYLTGEDILVNSVVFSSISGALTASEILGRNVVIEAFALKSLKILKRHFFGSGK
ncbi:unnamed protein product [Notodromas monacha]|uniref:Uncharacterized protein n=1 Tax=Notodromas monacha TaxID=399045 RepID=A0A7R9BXD5_9CRUS|nr:unnamed protein product [Notodromas monacha]CAG0923534.1 unnamed protein product [Notodromas monacha]